jgi:hypothetical protein
VNEGSGGKSFLSHEKYILASKNKFFSCVIRGRFY